MTRQRHASGRGKCDQLLQRCKTKHLDKQVKQIVTNFAAFAAVLVALETKYPSNETDLSIRTEIGNLPMLPNNPKGPCIGEPFGDPERSIGRLTPGSYGSDKLLFWLVPKFARKVSEECGATAERKARTLTY